MTQRLTRELEATIRDTVGDLPPGSHSRFTLTQLLAEIAALRAELAGAQSEVARLNASLLDYWGEFGATTSDNGRLQAALAGAEERGAARELEAAVTFLRSLNYEHVPSMLERGDHRTGATPPDAGESRG